MARKVEKFPGNDKPKEAKAVPAEVELMPYHDNMSVEEALEYVRREAPDQVLIVFGSICEDCGGHEVQMRQGGSVNNAEAVFLLEKAKLEIFNGG